MIGIYLHYAIRSHYENYLLHEWEFEIKKLTLFFSFHFLLQQARRKRIKTMINKQKPAASLHPLLLPGMSGFSLELLENALNTIGKTTSHSSWDLILAKQWGKQSP